MPGAADLYPTLCLGGNNGIRLSLTTTQHSFGPRTWRFRSEWRDLRTSVCNLVGDLTRIAMSQACKKSSSTVHISGNLTQDGKGARDDHHAVFVARTLALFESLLH